MDVDDRNDENVFVYDLLWNDDLDWSHAWMIVVRGMCGG